MSRLCSKVLYLTAAEARRVARRLRRLGGEWVGIQAYRCAACHFWHIGHRFGTKKAEPPGAEATVA
jgi:hypothetical protein